MIPIKIFRAWLSIQPTLQYSSLQKAFEVKRQKRFDLMAWRLKIRLLKGTVDMGSLEKKFEESDGVGW